MRILICASIICLTATTAGADVIDQFANPCPEGQYQALDGSCGMLLRPHLGFDRSAFLGAFSGVAGDVVVSGCSESALDSALSATEQNGGGIVEIPACRIVVDDKLHVPDNTILRGSGAGTVLEAASGFSTHMLDIDGRENVVVQDMTLIGASATGKGIVIRRSTNVLVERVEIDSFGHSNLTFRHSSRVTARYSRYANAKSYHGIDSKDCGPGDPDVSDLQECQATAGNIGSTGSVFTSDYSVYSNLATGNGGQGFDIHASEGEFAGNRSIGNTYAGKFPDAWRILLHDNRFDGGKGVKFYSTRSISGHDMREIVLHRNQFDIDDGTYTFRNDVVSTSLYAIDNTYEPSDPRKITNPGVAYACPNTPETDLVDYGYNDPMPAPSGYCAGGGFLQVFGETPPGPAPPPAPPQEPDTPMLISVTPNTSP